jgi:hypothetical protein
MNLVDALCVIASSYNARSPEEEQVYVRARTVVEEHAEIVMLQQRAEALCNDADQLMFGMKQIMLGARNAQERGSLQ